MSAGGGACFTTNLCVFRNRSAYGRKSHAKIPGRYSLRHVRKLSSSWNVTYARMLRCGSPILSFCSARIAASAARSSAFFCRASRSSLSTFCWDISGSSLFFFHFALAISNAPETLSRSFAKPSNSDVFSATCTSCTFPILLSKNFQISCGSCTSSGISRTTTE